MAQENNEIKALGNIIPSMSLNKHINGIPNYSFHEAINMRMSDDRMAIQNIEEVNSHETIMNFLNSHYVSTYGELYYNDEKISNSSKFSYKIMNNFIIHDEEHYDEHRLLDAINDTYENIDFDYISIDELLSRAQTIEDYLEYPIDYEDYVEICDKIRTFNIQPNPNISNFKILYILPCNNELILFVWNKNRYNGNDFINGRKCVEFVRYNENTNEINVVYNDGITYYGGKYVAEYTYNYKNDLIMAFCEYDPLDDSKYIPLRVINLNEQIYKNYDLLLNEDLLNIKPKINLSNVSNTYFLSGHGYTGWHFLYIRYKINENRYTEWYNFGAPIKLVSELDQYLFSANMIINNDDCSRNENQRTKLGGQFVLNAGSINKTYSVDFNIDTNFLSYEIGIKVVNKTEIKTFKTYDIEIGQNSNQTFIFNKHNLKEESFDTQSYINYYNVKNIVNYKNEIYISNYKYYKFKDCSKDVNIQLNTFDKTNEIIKNEVIDNISLFDGNISLLNSIPNFENNILWLMLDIDSRKPSLGIYNGLSNIRDNIIYIRQSTYVIRQDDPAISRVSGKPNDYEGVSENGFYKCNISDVTYSFYYIRTPSELDNKTILQIDGKTVDGQIFKLRGLAYDEEGHSVDDWKWTAVPIQYHSKNRTYLGANNNGIGGTGALIEISYTDAISPYTEKGYNSPKSNANAIFQYCPFPRYLIKINPGGNYGYFTYPTQQYSCFAKNRMYLYENPNVGNYMVCIADSNEPNMPAGGDNDNRTRVYYRTDDCNPYGSDIISDYYNKLIGNNNWQIASSIDIIHNNPNIFTINRRSLFTDLSNYYLTTLPPFEVLDLYVHFINKYGEISDGFRLNSENYLVIYNDVLYVFYLIENLSIVYGLPANKKFKEINLSITPVISMSLSTFISLGDNAPWIPYTKYEIPSSDIQAFISQGISRNGSITNYWSIDVLPENIKYLFGNYEFDNNVSPVGTFVRGGSFKDLYTNNIANYTLKSTWFIPYINSNGALMFKTTSRMVSADQNKVTGLRTYFRNTDSDILGFFISFNNLEHVINDIGISIVKIQETKNNKEVIQYYSILNDVIEHIGFNNFYIRYGEYKLFTTGVNNKTFIDTLIGYAKIRNLLDYIKAFAGELKYGRRGKSSILTDKLYINGGLIKGDKTTNGYITALLNLNNDFYLNTPILHRMSNYLYKTGTISSNYDIDNNLLGEYYSILHYIFNEEGVSFYYEVNPDASNQDHIDIDVENLSQSKYKTDLSITSLSLNKFEILSSYCLNLKFNKNPLQLGTNMFFNPEDAIGAFTTMLEEWHKVDTDIYSKNDETSKLNIFNNMINYSNVINDESMQINWIKFNAEAYKIISSNKGKIVKIALIGDYMFIHCEQAIYLLQFKDYLATTEESLQITQSSIKDISYKELLPTDKGYAGLQDKDAAIIGSFGYIFYENDTYRILRLDNGQLMYIDYPILQWLQKYKPYEVRFANDVKRNNLLIQLKYKINNIEKILILLYDYILNSFISVLNNSFYFDFAYNTKNKLYLLQNNSTNSIIKCFNDYKFEKNIFNVLNKENEYIQLTNKLSFVYNINYNAIKYLESIMFKAFKYIKSEDPQTINSIDFTEDPIETIRIPFCGDYIRIYNENVDTGWIDIKEAQDKDTYNNREHYELPYYYLGNWMMNMFRNVKDRKNDINYSKFDKQDYTEADDRARLYGNYFIVEFGFNMNDSKYENEESDKFEFQSIEINVSQQFLQQ